jgi:outer membrane protein OmpA-like peptidoglycan-associated protein
MVVPILAISLGSGGCLVTTSTYEAKAKEAESLRNGLASTNKERTTLEGKYVTIQKQLSDEKDANAALSSRVREQEEELGRTKEELFSLAKKYEGTRITREELISELLEKEKATGRRIQELNARAQSCETENERLRKEAVARETTISDLEMQSAKPSEMETLRRERDTLLGHIERSKEDRLQEARRRDLRFAELAKTFSGISPRIAAMPLGPAMRILVPDDIFFRKGKSTLTDAGKKVVGEVGKTASEFPTASIIITASGTSQAGNIQTVLTKGHSLPTGRVLTSARNRDRETEMLLVIP